MNLAPVLTLVDATGLFKRVGDALELVELQATPTLAMPAAFVIPDSESAATTQLGTFIFDQLVTSLFAVVVIVGADGARRGVAQAALHELEEGVIGCLAGASLAGLDRPLEYVDARLVGLGGGRVSRLLRFRSVRRIRRTRTPS